MNSSLPTFPSLPSFETAPCPVAQSELLILIPHILTAKIRGACPTPS